MTRDRRARRRMWLLVLPLLAAACGDDGERATNECSGERWVGAWAAAPSDRGPAYVGQSLRLIVTPLRGGETVRVRLSNRFGDQPVALHSAYLGKQLSGAQLIPGSNQPLRFGGNASVTIAAGAEINSDSLHLPFTAFEHLAVSLFVASPSGDATQHFVAMQTSFVAEPGSGDLSANEGSAGFTNTITSRPFVMGIDVLTGARDSVVVAIGDSITDGVQFGANLLLMAVDADARYPDSLARRLQALPAGSPLSVINLGISGNQVLRDGTTFGPSLLARLGADVLSRTDVTDVILLAGINDLGSSGASAAEVIDGLRRAVQDLKAQSASGPPNVLVGTLTPAGRAILPSYRKAEPVRQQVNDYIRSTGIGDGYVDFDRAVRDPGNPSWIAPAYDGGDGLHLSPAGYERMASEVALAELKGRSCSSSPRGLGGSVSATGSGGPGIQGRTIPRA